MMRENLSNWLWVIYPVVVVVFMLVGFNYVMGSGQTDLMQLMIRQDEAEAEKMRLDALSNKLAELKMLDIQRGREELGVLVQAMPASRVVWYMINELNTAAVVSGMRLVGYRGSIGDIREASESGMGISVVEVSQSAAVEGEGGVTLLVDYDSPDIAALASGLAELERLLPLIKVVQVDFSQVSGGNVRLTVEGAWKEWGRTILDPAAPLPDYQTEVREALVRLDQFETVDIESEVAETATEAGDTVL